jgi:hypothetical protein
VSAEQILSQLPLPNPSDIFPNTYEPKIPGMTESNIFEGEMNLIHTPQGGIFHRDILEMGYYVQDLDAKIPKDDPDKIANMRKGKNVKWVQEAREKMFEYEAIKQRRERIMYPRTSGHSYQVNHAKDLYEQLSLPIRVTEDKRLKIVDKAA